MSADRGGAGRAPGDSGVGMIELLLITPLLAIVAMVVAQVVVILLAQNAAHDAALAAARAYRTSHESVTVADGAANDAVDGWLQPVVASRADPNTWTVAVPVPQVIPFVGSFVGAVPSDVTAKAVLP
ncbi:MAG: hypothetical protein QOE76_3322 [Frankiales bacterium]|jgi:Flp pilus assembly protein TadG|nr:hypothetical protein [Frankiales bacterium]